MRDLTRTIGWAAPCGLVLGAALLLGGCSKEDASGACSTDGDCTRGEICEDGACSVAECDTLFDCPGSGRTCLQGLGRCSAKECADVVEGVERTCPDDRPICIEDGPHKHTCVGRDDLGCREDADCAAAGDGFTCCDGRCAAQCDEPLPPGDAGPQPADGGSADAGPDGAPPPADGGPADVGGDMGPPSPTGGHCSPCERDADCAPLGEGAKCTPFGQQNAKFCTAACEAGTPGQCPSGFTCVQGLDQCLPATFRCEPGCLTDGCPEGSICDAESGECAAPRGPCGPCAGDEDCAEGLTCGTVGGRTVCLAPCADGACDAGLTCDEDGLCKPAGGVCDACGGTCVDPTPACIEATGQCAECGPRHPCGDGMVCNPETHVCEEAMGVGCLGDVDCAENPDGSICFQGRCVECLQDLDCPPRHACDLETRACRPDPCGGVQCHGGGDCNPETGRCDPGCQTAMDCPVPDAQECNPQTGQCFNRDGSCDPAGRESVCAPGSTCTPPPLPGLPSSCSCEKEDPTNPASPDRIPCHPGGLCVQFLPELPGACIYGG